MPRSSTCAAAARPTGPAPRMATVFGLFSESGMAYSSPPRIIEILRQKNSGDLLEFRHDGGRARTFDAALRDHGVDQAVHLVGAGVADQCRALARLGAEADADQRLEVMREGRGGNVEPLLQAADRHALFTRPHQGAVDLQASRVAQGFQAGGGIVELHDSKVVRLVKLSNGISGTLEIDTQDRLPAAVAFPCRCARMNTGSDASCAAIAKAIRASCEYS